MGWGEPGNRSNFPAWVHWKKVICDAQSGGLGVGSIRAFNLALLGKRVWRFKSEKGALWHRIISSIYGSNGRFNGILIGENLGVLREEL